LNSIDVFPRSAEASSNITIREREEERYVFPQPIPFATRRLTFPASTEKLTTPSDPGIPTAYGQNIIKFSKFQQLN